MDITGKVLVEMDIYTLRQVDLAAALSPERFPEDKAAAESQQDWITDPEGIEAFNRILSTALPQVLVSTRSLDTRATWSASHASAIAGPGSASSSPEKSLQPKHPRPALANVYLAPENEIESQLGDIWQEVLGIVQIGIDDNFFEMNGDSLLAVQVVHQVREQFRINLPTSLLFEKPTIRELSAYIHTLQITVRQLQAPVDSHSDEREDIEL